MTWAASRRVPHLVTLGAEFARRRVGLRVIEQGIDTNTAEGRAMFGMPSVLPEYQRELIIANTRDASLRRVHANARGAGWVSVAQSDEHEADGRVEPEYVGDGFCDAGRTSEPDG